MQQVTLRASRRTQSGTRPTKRLRRDGLVPAIVYGKELEATPVAVDRKDLYRVLHTDAGLNALINVEVEEAGTILTVAREIQRHPVRNEITHLDFIKVSLDEAITADVGIEFQGEPVGVREDGGILEMIQASVEIEALPTAIPNEIVLDVSGLELGDVLTVADLPAIDGVTYLDDEDRPIVTVSLPAAEVVEEEEELEGEEVEEGAETPEAAGEAESGEDEDEG